MKKYLDKLSWKNVVIFCCTLGLAPFAPPHFFQKLNMLFSGSLSAPADWFDLFFHGVPWLVLVLKIMISKRAK